MKIFDIYELIEEIRPNVPMYVGDYSLIKLKSFLEACEYMAYAFGIECSDTPSFHGLHLWVAMRFLGHESAMGFCQIILEECSGDDKKALDMFFNLLDEYKSCAKPNHARELRRRKEARLESR